MYIYNLSHIFMCLYINNIHIYTYGINHLKVHIDIYVEPKSCV